jgi:hypothetical protein
MKSKISALATAIFSCTFAFGQDKNCIGKWKLYPQPQEGIISYLTWKIGKNEKLHFSRNPVHYFYVKLASH